MQKEEFSKATFEFVEAIKLVPTEEKYHDAFGKSLYKRGMTTEANAPFGIADDLKALKTKPSDMKILCSLAKAFQDKRMFSVSQIYIKKALSCEPGSDQVHFLMGRAFYLGDNYKGAMEQFEKAISLNPYCVDAYNGLLNVYSSQGKKKKQMEFEKYVKHIKQVNQSTVNAEAHAELAEVFRKYNKANLAKAEYGEALKLNGKCEKAIIGKGILQYNRGDTHSAQKQFLMAVKVNKYNSIPHSYLGLIYQTEIETRKQAEWELSLAKHLKKLETPKDHFKAYMILGDFFLEGKFMDDAEEAYLRALKLEAQNPEIRVKVGLLYAYTKKTEQAMDYCDQAIKLAPDNSIGHIGKGRIFIEIGELDQALACFQEALNFSQKDPEVHGYLAQTYKLKGLYKLADKEMRIKDSVSREQEGVL